MKQKLEWQILAEKFEKTEICKQMKDLHAQLNAQRNPAGFKKLHHQKWKTLLDLLSDYVADEILVLDFENLSMQ